MDMCYSVLTFKGKKIYKKILIHEDDRIYKKMDWISGNGHDCELLKTSCNCCINFQKLSYYIQVW